MAVTTETDSATGWTVVRLVHPHPDHPDGSLEARLVPAAGSNLFSLRVGGRELLRQASRLRDLADFFYGLAVLYPTPNRVRDGRFTFDGRTFSFPPNERTHFMHGLVYDLPWQWREAEGEGPAVITWLDWEPSEARFPLFPIRHRLSLTVSLDGGGVRLAFAVENRDGARLPFGFGIHPWFAVLGRRAQTFLRVAAEAHMEAHGLLPTGRLERLDGLPYDLREPRPLEGLALDDVYWGVRGHEPSGFEQGDRDIAVDLRASPEFTHMVVFTPPGRPWFCMENQTCSTDAHNLHARGLVKEAHLLIAETGQTIGGWMQIGPAHARATT